MRYRLRTLLIVLALGPPVLAGVWWGYGKYRESRAVRMWVGEFEIRDGKLVVEESK